MYTESRVDRERQHRQTVNAMQDVLNDVHNAWENLDLLFNRRFHYLLCQQAYKFCVWIDGEDILQETKFKTHRGLNRIKAIRNPEVRNEAVEALARSVYRLPRQAISDQIRRLKGDKSPAKNISLDEAGSEAYDAFFATEANSYEQVLASELLLTLTPEQRTMIYLHIIEEMTLREIAAALDIDKNRVHRVIKEALVLLVKPTLRDDNPAPPKQDGKGNSESIRS
jgi:RNA polymerase sigma factor (sigma-70 family)